MAKADGEKPRPKPTGKKAPVAKDERSQRERFIATARELKAEETGEQFERAFGRLVPTRPVKSTDP